MYALQPPPPHLQPVRQKRRAVRPKSRPQSHTVLALEAIVKISVNALLSTGAIATLLHLMPHRTAQEVKLKELQTAVRAAEQRVQRTSESFSQVFDPANTAVLMQEQSNRIQPGQRQVILHDPDTRAASR